MRRSLDWVWGAPASARDGHAETATSDRALEYERRARGAAELARRALEPPEPFPDGSPDALACGLYHHSIVWALEAWQAHPGPSGSGEAKSGAQPAIVERDSATIESTTGGRDSQGDAETAPEAEAEDADKAQPEAEAEAEAEVEHAAPPSDEAATDAKPQDADRGPAGRLGAGAAGSSGIAALWERAKPEALLNEANVSPEEATAVVEFLSGRGFADYADLPSEEQVRWARRLRVVAEGLLYGLEVVSGRFNPPWLTRVLRVGLVLVLLVGVGWGGLLLKDWVVELDNIARGKPWVISSTYPAGCRSPVQTCMESPNFFFHTQEENQPWMEIDLGSVQRFSSVKIENRRECCTERAVPLILEVSSDGQKWQQLARKNEIFTKWHADFEPVEARWVRLRLARRGILHLASVDIYK